MKKKFITSSTVLLALLTSQGIYASEVTTESPTTTTETTAVTTATPETTEVTTTVVKPSVSSPELPNTGAVSTFVYAFLGSFAVLCGLLALVSNFLKKKDTKSEDEE